MAPSVLFYVRKVTPRDDSGKPDGTFVAVAYGVGVPTTMNLGLETEPKAFEEPAARPLPWFALQVRTQHERGVAEFLRGGGFNWFLPLYKCRKRWSDRVKEVEVPLFPGYLFCRFNPQDRLPILKTPGVIQIVGYNRQPVEIDEAEIGAIQTLVQSGMSSQPWPYLFVGDKVQIESGPLRGMSGILTNFKGKHRLIVSVSLLQRAVAVEIDAALVTPYRASEEQREARGYSQQRPMPVAI
jgi:transcription antitermination factor NusG